MAACLFQIHDYVLQCNILAAANINAQMHFDLRIFQETFVLQSIGSMGARTEDAITYVWYCRHEAHIRKIVSLMMAIQKTECLSGLFHRLNLSIDLDNDLKGP